MGLIPKLFYSLSIIEVSLFERNNNIKGNTQRKIVLMKNSIRRKDM